MGWGERHPMDPHVPEAPEGSGLPGGVSTASSQESHSPASGCPPEAPPHLAGTSSSSPVSTV